MVKSTEVFFRKFATEPKKKKPLPLVHPIIQQQKPIEVPERLKTAPRVSPKNAITEPGFFL